MTNHPHRSRFDRWIAAQTGLSDEPLRRAAQLGLRAIHEAFAGRTDDTAMVAAYTELHKALGEDPLP